MKPKNYASIYYQMYLSRKLQAYDGGWLPVDPIGLFDIKKKIFYDGYIRYTIFFTKIFEFFPPKFVNQNFAFFQRIIFWTKFFAEILLFLEENFCFLPKFRKKYLNKIDVKTKKLV